MVGLYVSSCVRVAQSHPHQGILSHVPLPCILSSRSLGSVGHPTKAEPISHLISIHSSHLNKGYLSHASSCLCYASFCCKLFTWRGDSIGDLRSLLHSTVPSFLPLRVMSAPPIPAGLPLDDRSKDLKIPIVALTIFSSIFVILRLCVSFRNRNFHQFTDHLLWTGHVRGCRCQINLDQID